MTATVISAGQCGFDSGGISRMIGNVGGSVITTDSMQTTLAKALEIQPNLILINRIFDATGESGLECIKKFKEDKGLQNLPLMLISNYEDAQQQAVALGALRGFGKRSLSDKAVIQLLKQILQSST